MVCSSVELKTGPAVANALQSESNRSKVVVGETWLTGTVTREHQISNLKVGGSNPPRPSKPSSDRTPSVMVWPEWAERKKTQGCERPMQPSEALAQGPQEPVTVTCDRYCTAGTRMAPHGNLGFLGQKNRKAGESDRRKVTQPSYV